MTRALRKKVALRRRRAPIRHPARITESSGNVFADLGFKDPKEHLLKAELVRRIAAAMKQKGLNQTAAARVLGVEQPDVSKMLRGHFRQFSVERLLRFLVALGWGVEIVVHEGGSARAEDPQIIVTTRA